MPTFALSVSRERTEVHHHNAIVQVEAPDGDAAKQLLLDAFEADTMDRIKGLEWNEVEFEEDTTYGLFGEPTPSEGTPHEWEDA